MNDAANDIPAIGLNGRLTENGHEGLHQVYFADTDFSGVVYHARYLEFLERGRSDYLRILGIHHDALIAGSQGEALVWVVRKMAIEFKGSAKIDDVLSVKTRVHSVSGARIQMHQDIWCHERLLITAEVEAALISPEGKPRRFPKAWLPLFQRS